MKNILMSISVSVKVTVPNNYKSKDALGWIEVKAHSAEPKEPINVVDCSIVDSFVVEDEKESTPFKRDKLLPLEERIILHCSGEYLSMDANTKGWKAIKQMMNDENIDKNDSPHGETVLVNGEEIEICIWEPFEDYTLEALHEMINSSITSFRRMFPELA